MDFFNYLLTTIEAFHFWGYWIVLLVSLVESLAFVGLVIPGTIFIVFVGFIAEKGVLDLGELILFAAVGAIIGDVLSYYLGSHIKNFIGDDSIILRSKYLRRGENFFNKYGGRSIFLGRFIGPIRPIIPFVAGMLRMDKKIFLFWNIFSGFAWAAVFLMIGYFFGDAIEVIISWITRGSVFVGIFAGIIFILYAARRVIFKKAKIL